MRANCSLSTRPSLRRAVIAACNVGLFIFRQLPIHRAREFSLNPQSLLMSLPVFAMLMIGGCPDKHSHPTFIRTGVTAPPHVVRRDANTAPPAMDPPDTSQWSVIVVPLPTPKRPAARPSQNPTEPEVDLPTKPEAPQISPQLSAAEIASAQASADADIQVAQHNLSLAAGRKLKQNQKDMADKIGNFLKQAQDAKASSDWLRARSLAQKARLLSNDLVNSF
jgi:hypothetical protein